MRKGSRSKIGTTLAKLSPEQIFRFRGTGLILGRQKNGKHRVDHWLKHMLRTRR